MNQTACGGFDKLPTAAQWPVLGWPKLSMGCKASSAALSEEWNLLRNLRGKAPCGALSHGPCVDHLELYLGSHTAQLHREVTAGVADADHQDPLSSESLHVSVFPAVQLLALEATFNAWAESREHLLLPDTLTHPSLVPRPSAAHSSLPSHPCLQLRIPWESPVPPQLSLVLQIPTEKPGCIFTRYFSHPLECPSPFSWGQGPACSSVGASWSKQACRGKYNQGTHGC